MTKTDRYEKALELLDNCCKRNELSIIVHNMVGEDNDYLDTCNIGRDNAKDIVEAINLIGADVVRDFIEKELGIYECKDLNGYEKCMNMIKQ